MERPIILSGPMVRAILDGRKTQTRRVMKPQPIPEGATRLRKYDDNGMWWPCRAARAMIPMYDANGFSPYGGIGNKLWVRETWAPHPEPENHRNAKLGYTYRADWDLHDDMDLRDFDWRSPIHMPRWASRITLVIREIRVERVQDISEEDAIAEGVKGTFRAVWDSINASRGFGWEANPWVWVVVFEREVPNGD